jgi:hypothetical protein
MGATASNRAFAELGHLPQRRYAFEDPGLAVEPAIISNSPTDVAEVVAEENYSLFVRFFDGTSGRVEMRERIFRASPNIFAKLVEPKAFAAVGLAYGTVAWSDEIDLAPDRMYDELKRNGVWVLR